MTQEERDGRQLISLLAGDAPDPLQATDLMIIAAIRSGLVEARLQPGLQLAITVGQQQLIGQSCRVKGDFRSALARLGNIFAEMSNAFRGIQNLAPVGRLSQRRIPQSQSYEGWEVAGASFSDIPGSPLYLLRGATLELVRDSNQYRRLQIEMDNSGLSQWCCIKTAASS